MMPAQFMHADDAVESIVQNSSLSYYFLRSSSMLLGVDIKKKKASLIMYHC